MANINQNKIKASGVYIQPHNFLPIFKVGMSDNFIRRAKEYGRNDVDLSRGIFIPSIQAATLENTFKKNSELSKYKMLDFYSDGEIETFRQQSRINSLHEWYSMSGFKLCLDIARQHCDVILPTALPEEVLSTAIQINTISEFTSNLHFLNEVYLNLKKALDNDFYYQNTTLSFDKFFNDSQELKRIELTLTNFKFEASELSAIKSAFSHSADFEFMDFDKCFYKFDLKNSSLTASFLTQVDSQKSMFEMKWDDDLGKITTIDLTFNESVKSAAVTKALLSFFELFEKFNKKAQSYSQR